jgi:hypothetical protein
VLGSITTARGHTPLLLTRRISLLTSLQDRHSRKTTCDLSAAIKSMLGEISGLVEKSCFEGVHLSELAESEVKKIIRS